MTHLPEPWTYEIDEEENPEEEQRDQIILDANDKAIMWACSCCDHVNARPVDMIRIVLCVNYCAGLSNEELEKGRDDTKS